MTWFGYFLGYTIIPFYFIGLGAALYALVMLLRLIYKNVKRSRQAAVPHRYLMEEPQVPSQLQFSILELIGEVQQLPGLWPIFLCVDGKRVELTQVDQVRFADKPLPLSSGGQVVLSDGSFPEPKTEAR